MNAQKLSNNRIALSQSAIRKDAIEIIEDLRLSEFYKLMKSARNWSENLNDKRDIIFTQYENEDSKVYKEFNKILKRRKLFEEKLNSINIEVEDNIPTIKKESLQINDENVKSSIIWASRVKGTSRLLRIPKKQIIKIVRRKGLMDDNNRPNSVCISNNLREEFFDDCKKSYYFQDNKLYEIMYSENDKEVYEKWDSLITKIYNEGIFKGENK